MADDPSGGERVPKPPGRESGPESPGTRKPAPKPRPAPEPIDADRDDDFDDLDDFNIGPVMTVWMRLGYVIMLLGVAAIVIYLVLIILYPDQFATPDWIGEKSPKKNGKASIEVDLTQIKSFKIGGLHLGDSLDVVRRTFPSISLQANPNFGPSDHVAQIGRYRHHEGDHQAFFRGPKQGNRLFKVETRHTYAKISYLELLGELSGRYGKPQKSTCGAQEKEIGIRCELYWRMSETLVKAIILTTAPRGGGAAVTELFVQARDIRPDTYFSRLKAQQKKPAKKKKSLKDVRPGN